MIYASSNGDRWRLVRDPADGRALVRHAGNPASGGHITDIALAAFLLADRGGPEHRALWDLIGALADGGGPTPRSAST